MPIPTPDFQTQERQGQPNSTGTGTVCSTDQADISSFAALNGSLPHLDTSIRDDSSQNDRGDRPLSKEEADRLYEERMEDEYAKREGGA